MKTEDVPKFAQLLLVMGEVYSEQVSDTRLEAYRLVLGDYEFSVVEAAMRRAMRTLKFFPKPAEIVELIEGGQSDRAAMAWAAFLSATEDGGYASVKFLEPATAIAMDAVFGSWIQACQLLHTCEPEMKAHYLNQFTRQYTAAMKTSRDAITYRPGLSEFSMRDGGAWRERMTRAIVQPVLLVGARETRKVMMPFDPQVGTLRADAMKALTTGASTALQFAKQFAGRPALAAQPDLKALNAAPATKDEVVTILAEARGKFGESPYLKALEAAA